MNIDAINIYLQKKYKDASLKCIGENKYQFINLPIMKNYPYYFKTPQKAYNCLLFHENMLFHENNFYLKD